MTNKSIILLNGENIVKLAVVIIITGLFVYGIVYWFGGQREIDNKKDEQLQWVQNAVVIEKTNHWWGTSCLLFADDGKRYEEDLCSHYINGDHVTIVMYKDYYRWIKGLA